MGIAGTNREDAQVSEIRGESQRARNRGGVLGVRNADAAAIFSPPPDASIGHFARHGWRSENGAVTVLSRNDGGFSLILSERA
jgi:hypothetical protein